MLRRPPRSTPKPSSAASDMYERQANMQIFMFSNEDVNEFVNFPLNLLFNIICAKI